jgi:Domain of unknown function (DUF5666)
MTRLSGIVLPLVLAGPLIGARAQGLPPQAVSSKTVVTTTSAVVPPREATEITLDPASLLPDLPVLPREKASLIGGTVQILDRVRDQITVQIFGGGKMKIAFDPRTHFYNDGEEASAADLHKGDRVYLDTILDGSTVFAKSIRLRTTGSVGESQGTITSYRADSGELEIRDALSPQILKIRITPETRIVHGDQTMAADQLTPGTLVSVRFGAQQKGRDIAQELSVLAIPGASFTFGGRVTALDLRLGLLAIESSTDHKTYEIYFDPSTAGVNDKLREEANVTVLTEFDGSRYVARTVTVNPPPQ